MKEFGTIIATDFKITHTNDLYPANPKEYGTFKYGTKVWEGSISFDTLAKYLDLLPPPFELRQPYTIVPDGTYTPADFGFFLPKCKEINIGYCKTFGLKMPLKLMDIAHAHGEEPVMCVTSGAYIFKEEGVADDTIFHEYAHLVVGGQHGHDKVWETCARTLGVENPGPALPYNYYGDPKVKWSK